jgi:para-nitrobenzyl esterase
MMGMPAAQGLFHRAVTMSGQQVTASGPLNATARAKVYLEALKVSSADELLALPAERLVEGLAATDPILGGGVYLGRCST